MTYETENGCLREMHVYPWLTWSGLPVWPDLIDLLFLRSFPGSFQ